MNENNTKILNQEINKLNKDSILNRDEDEVEK